MVRSGDGKQKGERRGGRRQDGNIITSGVKPLDVSESLSICFRSLVWKAAVPGWETTKRISCSYHLSVPEDKPKLTMASKHFLFFFKISFTIDRINTWRWVTGIRCFILWFHWWIWRKRSWEAWPGDHMALQCTTAVKKWTHRHSSACLKLTCKAHSISCWDWGIILYNFIITVTQVSIISTTEYPNSAQKVTLKLRLALPQRK